MTSPRNDRRIVALALLPIVCCIGLPLMAGVTSIAVAAWVAGSATGAALAVVLIVLALRRHRRALAGPRMSKGRT
jgi:hypothetical protein